MRKNKAAATYAKMWPREVFNCKRKKEWLVDELDILSEPGVYVLYRNDIPYYVGKAGVLRNRLRPHANRYGSKHYLFWNYFSVFVVRDPHERGRLESYLIAAMPTANGAKPKIKKAPLPLDVRRHLHTQSYTIQDISMSLPGPERKLR